LGTEVEGRDRIEEDASPAEAHPPSNSGKSVETVTAEVVGEPLEKAQEEISGGEKSEIRLDPERVRVIEVQDSLFFAGRLFQDAFGDPPPVFPRNYVAIYEDSNNPSTFHVIGFVHLQQIGEMGLVAGLCVGRQWRGKGLGKILLESMENQDEWIKALFVYTGDPRIPAICGYESLSHPRLMAKWIKPLSLEKKEKMINIALAIGPF
jgi:N-acetylglutamate synthase-like GNAT family acetyltransferase